MMLQQWTRDILGVSFMHQNPERKKHIIVRKQDVNENMKKHFNILYNNDKNIQYDLQSILHPPFDVS